MNSHFIKEVYASGDEKFISQVDEVIDSLFQIIERMEGSLK